METKRWTYIDRVARSPKPFLTEDDLCFYYLQKDSLGFGSGPHAEENRLIINFKHDPAKFGKDSPQMYYKRKAVFNFASAVASFFMDNCDTFSEGVFLVPIPTSKPRSAQDHDARLDALCRIVEKTVPFVRFVPALDTVSNLGKAHNSQIARDPDSIARNLRVDRDGLLGFDGTVALIDDVLTTGAHFAACRDLISGVLPDVTLIGLFLSIQLPDFLNDSLGWDDLI